MTIESFVKRVFANAQAKGFDQYELYYQENISTTLRSFDQTVDSYANSQTHGVNFRGVINGKAASCYSEVLDDDAAYDIVERAYQAANLIENDDDIILVAADQSYAELDLYSDALSQLSNQQKISYITELDRTVAAHQQVDQVTAAYYGDATTTCRLYNSKGLTIGYRSNYCFASVSALTKRQEIPYSANARTHAKSLAELRKENLPTAVVQKLTAKFGAEPLPSGRYRVLLKNEASAALLSVFINAFKGDIVQKGMSLLKGKIDQKIASDVVDLIDNPHLQNGLASAPFDGEGVATFCKYLIKNGQLKTFLHNLNTSKKDGVTSTGNAARYSFKSSVEVAPSNAYFSAGHHSFDALVKQTAEGVMISELDGLHAGANAVTGDFSLSARGFLITSGQMTQPLRQIVLSGNYYQLLKEIEAVGDDLTFNSQPIGSPSLLICALEIAGESH